MKVELAKWELGILLNGRIGLLENGRDLGYRDEDRIKELRAFLDAQADEVADSKDRNIDKPVEVDGVSMPF